MKRLLVAIVLAGCTRAPASPPVIAPAAAAATAPDAPPAIAIVEPPPPPVPVTPPPPPPPDAPRRFFKLAGAQPYMGVHLGFAADHTLFFAGTFSDKLAIGKLRLKTDSWQHWFLARVRPDGELAWLKRPGVDLPGDVEGLAVAPDGTVALIGQYTVAKRKGNTPSRGEAALVVLGPDGKPRWERRLGGGERQAFTSVRFDRDGSVVVCGAFGGTVDFGGTTLTTVMGQFVPSVDAFVARYTSEGKLAWVTSGGGADDDGAQLVAVAPSGDLVVAGSIGRRARFEQVALAGPGASAIGNPSRLFVAGYTAAGRLRWASEYGHFDLATPDALVPLADGSVLVHGQDQDLATPTAAVFHGFLLQLDDRGRLLQDRKAEQATGVASADSVLSMRVDGRGTLVYERHDVARATNDGTATLPKLPFRVLGLTRDADGRVALAGQAGLETEKELPNRYVEVSYAAVDLFVALAPAPDQLPLQP